MTSPAITRRAIAAARAILMSRLQAAARGEDMEDLEDVVIARNVTLKELDRMPEEWFDGLKVALRMVGLLIAIDQFCHVCAGARAEVTGQVVDYTRVNCDRRAYGLMPATLHLEDRGRASADLGIYTEICDSGAFVVFETEPAHRSGSQMGENAARFLTHVPNIECVVCFKFFAPRKTPLVDPIEVRLPALVVVFRRCPPGPDSRLGRIQVAAIHSIGNDGIAARALSFIHRPTAHHLVANPLDSVDHLKAPSPVFPDSFDLMNLCVSLDQALARAHEMARASSQAEKPTVQTDFSVRVHKSLPAIQLDLAEVYANAVRAISIRKVVVGADVGEEDDPAPGECWWRAQTRWAFGFVLPFSMLG